MIFPFGHGFFILFSCVLPLVLSTLCDLNFLVSCVLGTDKPCVGWQIPASSGRAGLGKKQGALGLLIINIFNYFFKLFTLLAAIIAAKSLYGTSVAGGDLECAWVCFWAWQPFLTSRDNDSQLGKTRNINRFWERCASRVKTEKAPAGVKEG